jgi:PHD/YefM family antitoxin component YafN of YafNO toxin-antitoxin module
MQVIDAPHTVSISEFKKDPMKVIHDAERLPTAIINGKKAVAYFIPAKTFKKMVDDFENRQDYLLAVEVLARKGRTICWEEVKKGRDLRDKKIK